MPCVLFFVAFFFHFRFAGGKCFWCRVARSLVRSYPTDASAARIDAAYELTKMKYLRTDPVTEGNGTFAR